MNAAQGLLSPSDIADMAGVSRAAVSNWRKRLPDFPQPVGGSAAKPLFSAEEVRAWLEGRGHQLRQDAGESQVWAAMNLLRGSLSVDDAADLLLSLLVARKTGTAADASVWNGVDPGTQARVEDAIGAVDVGDLSAVADFALERLAKSQGKSGADLGFVGSRTATLLANLAAARPGGTLYDPACGIAAALLQAVTLGAQPDKIVGHDINPWALQLAGKRAELHDVALDLVEADVLTADPDPDLRADTIILEPPVGLRFPDTDSRMTDPRFVFGTPPQSSADTAWLQHVVAHLSATGRGYVLTAHGVLSRGTEREIRSKLVAKGCVEAVVGLPGKLLPNITIPLALWVVRHPLDDPSDARVLFIDASEEPTPEDSVKTWLNEPTALDTVPHVTVPIADVLGDDAQLTPRQWITGADLQPDDMAARYTDGWLDIHATIKEIHDTTRRFPAVTVDSTVRVLTVGELIEDGALELAVGKPKERYTHPDHADRIITPADIRSRNLPPAPTDDTPETTELTQPGDILVTTTHTIQALVDTTGGHLPTSGVHRLRVLNDDLLPGYLAAALTGGWNNRFLTGTTIQRATPRHLEIPLLSKIDQHTIQQAATTLELLHAAAEQLVTRADTLRTVLLDAVRHNVPLATTPTARTRKRRLTSQRRRAR